MAGEAERLGIYGFGAAAHIVAQVARHGRAGRCSPSRGRATQQAQDFARELGAVWAGGSDRAAARARSTPRSSSRRSGALVPAALAAVGKGGVVVAGGIHMSDIPSFPYRILWGERVVRSVANLTRARRRGVPGAGPQGAGPRTVQRYPLSQANEALDDLRAGRLRGAAVLVPGLGRSRERAGVSAVAG